MVPPPVTRLVVIGGSAGALPVVRDALAAVPGEPCCAVVVLVHSHPDARSILTTILARECRAKVGEPLDKQPITPGVWIAPPGYHLLVTPEREFGYSVDEPVHHSRPSIDVLFESAAEAFGDAALGVVLSGASPDGAAGARAIAERGGRVWVQAPETAEVDMMPRAALSAVRAARVVDPRALGAALAQECGGPP